MQFTLSDIDLDCGPNNPTRWQIAVVFVLALVVARHLGSWRACSAAGDCPRLT